MSKSSLQNQFERSLKNCPVENPWKFLPARIPFQSSQHHYSLYQNEASIRTNVRIYGPIVEAAALYSQTVYREQNYLFSLISRKSVNGAESILEHENADGTTLLIVASKNKVRMSQIESDGSRLPVFPFADMGNETLTMLMLALMPSILDVDKSEGHGELAEAISEMGKNLDAINPYTWKSQNDIPEVVQVAAYYLDAVYTAVFENHMNEINFSPLSNSSTPAEIDESYFTNSTVKFSGLSICENLGSNGWTPSFINKIGSARKFPNSTMTLGEARAMYSVLSEHRTYTKEEVAMIPVFDENLPIMEETLRLVSRYFNTRNDTNPVSTMLWRGETGFGKTTGVRQFGYVINRPTITQTCFPSMEVEDLCSTIVPLCTASKQLAHNDFVSPSEAANSSDDEARATAEYVVSRTFYMTPKECEELLDTANFFSMVVMDQDAAEKLLFGKVLNVDTAELCAIYTEAHEKITQKQITDELKNLKNGSNSNSTDINFIHVIAPFMLGMTKGYVVELQEPSRIKDSGVLVAFNNFDHAGATRQLVNGTTVTRHPDAIWITTDNVGYASTRPLDQSFIRRNGLIIDSYDPPKEVILKRVSYNTGVTDKDTLELSYNLWNCVREFCNHNSITDGSISPVELERFVQAIRDDGLESIRYNLDDCIISKATCDIESQKDIRSSCETLYMAY